MTYKINQLVHREDFELGLDDWNAPIQIVSDLDQTYLNTQFETFFQLAKTALQSADKKATLPGAHVFFKILRWKATPAPLTEATRKQPNGLHFISSSPKQMRAAIQEKLFKDHLDWTSLTLKDQVYNIVHRRMDQLRQHVIFKSAAIFSLMNKLGPAPREWILVGDNTESDPFIYGSIAQYLNGKLTGESYIKKLTEAGTPTEIAVELQKNLPSAEAAQGHKVKLILIRKAKEVGGATIPNLEQIHLFTHYSEAAKVLRAYDVFNDVNLDLFQSEARYDIPTAYSSH